MLELADVARPAIRTEPRLRLRLGTEQELQLVVRLAVHDEEVAREPRNVPDPAVAQRRQHDLHDLDAVVEVLAELTPPHHLVEFAVSRSDNAGIGLLRPRAAHPLELAVLQESKELGL